MPDFPANAALSEPIQALFESAPNGVAALDGRDRMRIVNGPLAQMFGYPADALRGQPAALLFSGGLDGERGPLRQEVQEHGRARRSLAGLRHDGSSFPTEIVLTPFMGGEGGALLMIVADTTERHKAQERQNLLIGELHHRTQNIFAVIQSVAMRTLSGERTLEEARHIFINRLHAMSRTYTMLTEGAWEGAPLDQIVKDEIAAFSARVSIVGEAIMIQPSAAQTFAMIVHELATNALKHGSLSASDGHVSVAWDLVASASGTDLRFTWTERGGPPVAKPSRKGFGHTILEDATRHLGRAAIAYGRFGLSYEIVAPLASVGWSLAGAAPGRP
jgi:PAS domain S-box-containing protein